jgi:uncharacterized protein YjbJ (UPF0337 family)
VISEKNPLAKGDDGMHTQNFSEIWNDIQHDVQRTWDRLTDEDIQTIHGDYESLISFLQDRYNYSRQEASLEVDRFLRQAGHEVDEFRP